MASPIEARGNGLSGVFNEPLCALAADHKVQEPDGPLTSSTFPDTSRPSLHQSQLSLDEGNTRAQPTLNRATGFKGVFKGKIIKIRIVPSMERWQNI